ncbi:MAG: 4Fe-4S dicluster domain-containing protein [Thermoguttaceae bacterium]
MHTTQISHDVALVEELAHTRVRDCYQCGKCSAGCPMSEKMDTIPSTLIRLVQINQVENAAQTKAVWQCVSCQTCSTRCPKSVNIAGVLDALKQISIERKLVHPDYKRVVAFQKTFLDTIRRNGRTNELELVAGFKIRAFFGDFSIPLALKDAMLGPKMLLMGKLHLKLGAPVKDKAIVKRIFKKCMQ